MLPDLIGAPAVPAQRTREHILADIRKCDAHLRRPSLTARAFRAMVLRAKALRLELALIEGF